MLIRKVILIIMFFSLAIADSKAIIGTWKTKYYKIDVFFTFTENGSFEIYIDNKGNKDIQYGKWLYKKDSNEIVMKVHYVVLDIKGKKREVVSYTPDEQEKSIRTFKLIKKGDDIVLEGKYKTVHLIKAQNHHKKMTNKYLKMFYNDKI